MSVIPGIHPDNLPRRRKSEVPILDIRFPRRVTSVHQIEVTSRCNLRCPYCIHPKMERPKQDMELHVFDQALKHVAHYVAGGTQHDLNLSGTGEPTMHPMFPLMLRMAREVMGPDRKIIFPTNGVGYDFDLVKALAVHRPAVWVSKHRPEKAGIAREWWRAVGCLEGESEDPTANSNDWAGQVDWHISHQFALPCMWLRQGMVFVESTGEIAACCLDGDGGMRVGSVWDAVGSLRNQPGPLCKDCHQVVGVRGLADLDDQAVDAETGAARRKLPVVT